MNTHLFRLMKARRWSGRLQAGFSQTGRWHSGGRAVIYMAQTPSLALLEWVKGKFSQGLLAEEVSAAKLLLVELRCDLELQDIYQPELDSLPDNWWSIPNSYSTATQKLGNDWLDARKNLALRIPSATLPPTLSPAQESNLLLNPNHPGFDQFLLDGETIEHAFNLHHYLGFPGSPLHD